jgi:hypothetical protein
MRIAALSWCSPPLFDDLRRDATHFENTRLEIGWGASAFFYPPPVLALGSIRTRISSSAGTGAGSATGLEAFLAALGVFGGGRREASIHQWRQTFCQSVAVSPW